MPCDAPAAPRPRRPFKLTGGMVAAMLVLFFGVIVSVNATILTVALRTMPGVETKSAYETSQHFNEEIARQQERDARGWKAVATLARQGEGAALGVTLADRLGQPLSGYTATARLRHPATSARDHAVTLNERQPGRYEAGLDRVETGSWILELQVRRGEEIVFASRSRITLPEK
ncbi:FixH family protein [Bosea beijingensis]|uniref:FixH family protein n=1 Tax=Bosea beijingensis TaxID=3068632 RepID=UPI0027428FDB|nr:FixH family protein [Bosea sp. REN20]